jgi:propanol-preferring alcohol dehydrogenase
MTRSMIAMVLDAPGQPLRKTTLPVPQPREREVLIHVSACGVCRTDLHIVDGELAPHLLPLVPGHEIVGLVAAAGPAAHRFRLGQRVGVPWLGGSCGRCEYCLRRRENLCDRALFTGYDRHGGYAEYTPADERYCFALPDAYDDLHAAPLLCAGLIGYRAYAMARRAQRLGLYGFGAAAHLIAQLALHQGREVYAFTRAADTRSRDFARTLGVAWAGPSDALPPAPLDAAILFAPAGELVPRALAAIRKGGVVICAGIHMSDIPRFPYALLWGERCVRSVANLTRADGLDFFRQVADGKVATTVSPYPLEAANEALADLRAGRIDGAAVLVPANAWLLSRSRNAGSARIWPAA